MRFDGSRPIVIGGNQNNAGANEADYLFRGSIDDAVAFAEALSASDVAALAAG
jgi:uncharacterized membrane protein